MKALKTALSLLPAAFAIAVFAFPVAAQAEYLVPPGNSAATQYTEAVPTAGGPKTTNKPRHGQGRSPDQALGAKNAAQLEAQGPEGRAAAEVAAATAPSTTALPASGNPGEATQNEASNQGSGGSKHAGSQSGGGSKHANGGGSPSGKAAPAAQQSSGGSSGLGEVIAQATGSSSSGDLGLLLPLIVLAALAWSVAFVLRQRKRPTE